MPETEFATNTEISDRIEIILREKNIVDANRKAVFEKVLLYIKALPPDTEVNYLEGFVIRRKLPKDLLKDSARKEKDIAYHLLNYAMSPYSNKKIGDRIRDIIKTLKPTRSAVQYGALEDAAATIERLGYSAHEHVVLNGTLPPEITVRGMAKKSRDSCIKSLINVILNETYTPLHDVYKAMPSSIGGVSDPHFMEFEGIRP